jgi:hypothetical protein
MQVWIVIQYAIIYRNIILYTGPWREAFRRGFLNGVIRQNQIFSTEGEIQFDPFFLFVRGVRVKPECLYFKIILLSGKA